MNPVALSLFIAFGSAPFIIPGVAIIITRRVEIGGESGPPVAIIEGPPAIVIGAVLVAFGLAVISVGLTQGLARTP